MKGKMQGVTLIADWDPSPVSSLAERYRRSPDLPGSLVWRHPRFEIREYDIPTPGPEEVLLEVKPAASAARMFTWPRQTRRLYLLPRADRLPQHFRARVLPAWLWKPVKTPATSAPTSPSKAASRSLPRKCCGAGSASLRRWPAQPLRAARLSRFQRQRRLHQIHPAARSHPLEPGTAAPAL